MIDLQWSWSEYKFSPYDTQQILPKIVVIFECGDGETIYTFLLYNLPREA